MHCRLHKFLIVVCLFLDIGVGCVAKSLAQAQSNQCSNRHGARACGESAIQTSRESHIKQGASIIAQDLHEASDPANQVTPQRREKVDNATQFVRICSTGYHRYHHDPLLPVLKVHNWHGDPTEVDVPEWHGRIGNNVFQLKNAIFLAACGGAPAATVVLAVGGYVRKLFPSLPTSLWINATDAWAPPRCEYVQCRSAPDCRGVWFSFIRTTFRERQIMFQSILRPYLDPIALNNCGGVDNVDKADADADTLTIHLRSGDTRKATMGDHMQPPCAMYYHAMEAGNGVNGFKSVLVVAEDKYHPCIDGLRARAEQDNRAFRMSSSTVANDVCFLINAEHLFVSDSSFAAVALLFNNKLKRLFRHLGQDHLGYTGDNKACLIEMTEAWQQSNSNDLCASLYPRVALTFYKVPRDSYYLRLRANSTEYMQGYNASKLVVSGCPEAKLNAR